MSSILGLPFSVLGRAAGRLTLLFGCVLIASACASLKGPATDEAALRQEAQALQQKLAESPGDATLHRDLGTIYVRLEKPDSARRHLQRAHETLSTDPKTIYFLGLAQERSGNLDRALALFGQYTDVPATSEYRTLLRNRHERLRRTKARRTIQARAEGQADTTELSPRTVAVFPLSYQGTDSTYAPLGRGLGEFVLTDLSHVGRLRVVERIRLQALFNELKLAESEYVDPATAPRVGRLIGAGRLIGGRYDVEKADQAEETITVNLSVVNLTAAVQSPETDSTTGKLSELFSVQNDLVFNLVDRLGVELTAEERAAIEQVPTRNLEAFLAYSRGLRAEDRGRYDLAVQRYRQAAQLDPNFDAAVQAQEQAQRLREGSKTGADALADVSVPVERTSALDLQQLRQRNLSEGTAPTRQPAGEQTTATEGLLDGAPPLPSPGGSQ